MKNKSFLLFSLICSPSFLFAISKVTGLAGQTTSDLISVSERSAGVDLRTGDSLVFRNYQTSSLIREIYADTTGNTLFIVGKMKNKQKAKQTFICYDLAQKHVEWHSTFKAADNLHVLSDILCVNQSGKSRVLDASSGKEIYKTGLPLCYYNPENGVGFVYRNSGNDWAEPIYDPEKNSKYQLEGLHLATDAMHWVRDMSVPPYWSQTRLMNDSTLWVVANGFHTINLYSGEGWSYPQKVSAIGPTQNAVTLGVVGGLVGGMVGGLVATAVSDAIQQRMGYGVSDVKKLHSEPLEDGDRLFVASVDHLSCLNKNTGKSKWLFTFEEGKAGYSGLYLRNGLLYMLSYGVGFQYGNALPYGTAFFAAFDPQTGEMKFNHKIPGKDPILDFRLRDDRWIILCKKQLVVYDDAGNMKTNIQFDSARYGKRDNMFCNEGFIVDEKSGLTAIAEYAPDHYFLSNKENTLQIDSEFNILHVHQPDKIILPVFESDGFSFVNYEDKTLVFNPENKRVADLEKFDSFRQVSKRIFAIRQKEMLEIDLSVFN